MRNILFVFVGFALAPLSCGNSEDATTNQQILNRGEGKDNWWDHVPRESWSRFERVEQSQEWFEVYRIQPGILAIYEPGQFEEVISYLLTGSERSLLFDTGLGIGDMKRLVRELTETDEEPIVLNSHTHYDHIGGNHQFETVWGTDTAFTRQNAEGKDAPEVAEFVGPGWIGRETPSDFSAEAYRVRRFSIAKTVENGESIDLGGRTVEVLLTPGHCPDALCLLDRENQLLFTGDTFYTGPLYAHFEESNLDDYVASSERLAELQATVHRILPSHNETLIDAAYLTRMRDAFQAIRRRDAPFVLTDGNREYRFEGFSVLVK